MSNKWISPENCPSLAVLIETVTAPLLIQHSAPVGLEMEVDASIPVPADPKQTASLITTLVLQTLDEMPDGGEFNINASESASGLVLEICDDRRASDQRAHSIPMVAGALGVKLDWGSSENGISVKMTFPQRGQAGRMAA